MSKFIFKGYEYDTELFYINNSNTLVKVEPYNNEEIKVIAEAGWLTVDESFVDGYFIDTSKISTPQKVKIVPEEDKWYMIRDLRKNNTHVSRWRKEGDFVDTGHELADVEIMCEMMEKQP